MTEVGFKVSFDSLKAGKLGISSAYGSLLSEAADYCLHINQHPNPVCLSLTGDIYTIAIVSWSPVNESHSRTYADLKEAVQFAAYGVAIVIAVQLTELSSVTKAVQGTGIDYWLIDQDGFLKARLEVSGILKGDKTKIDSRLAQKIAQTEPSDESSLPAYIAVVEFGSPQTRFMKKKVPGLRK